MSHFTVAVLTAAQPTAEELAAILQPWHEFECTGEDDQYVQDIDRTAEALAVFESATVTMLKGPDGTLHNRFDDNVEWKPQFSKVGEHGRREGVVPPGFELVDVPAKDHESAATWINGWFGWQIAGQGDADQLKYGFIELDAEGNVARCIDRTNPNKKWDWWVVGGRWSGMIRLKPGASGVRGRPGVMGSQANEGPNFCDQARFGDIDLEAMRSKAIREAGALWVQARAATRDLPAIRLWSAVRAEFSGDIDKARETYWAQPGLKALKEAFPQAWDLDEQIDATLTDRAAFEQAAANRCLSTFAVVKDGQWFERGSMGWFGAVSDEKDDNAWSAEFAKLLEDQPDDSFITIVDCHI